MTGWNVIDATMNIIAWFRSKDEAKQFADDNGARLRVQEARRGPA